MATPLTNLIVCPLRSELEFLIEELQLHSWSIKQNEVNIGRVYISEEFSSLLIVGGLGEEKLIEKARRTLAHFNEIRRIICAGTAGRLCEEIKIGDVVFDSPHVLKDAGRQFKIHSGKVAKSARGDVISKGQKPLAIAIEGESLRELCRSSERKYVEIRGITDFADSNTERDFFTNQAVAMKHVAQTINAFFASQLPD